MSKNKKAKKTSNKTVKKAASKASKTALKKQAKSLKSKGNKEQKVASKVAEKKDQALASAQLLNAQAMAKVVAVEELKEEVILTNAEGKRYCRVSDCDEVSMIDGYCRLHYIMYWKRNKNKLKILEGGKLDKYIEELTQRYPDKYLEILKKDLLSEKEFNTIITEMDQDDAGDDVESEEEDNRFVEEIRGGIPTGSDDDEF
ncbi:MAG: hypothetical protein IPM57_05665 [Oligoflexia bacterium]|nr:hypothetical protein [Oligoflexia bacterium]